MNACTPNVYHHIEMISQACGKVRQTVHPVITTVKMFNIDGLDYLRHEIQTKTRINLQCEFNIRYVPKLKIIVRINRSPQLLTEAYGDLG